MHYVPSQSIPWWKPSQAFDQIFQRRLYCWIWKSKTWFSWISPFNEDKAPANVLSNNSLLILGRLSSNNGRSGRAEDGKQKLRADICSENVAKNEQLSTIWYDVMNGQEIGRNYEQSKHSKRCQMCIGPPQRVTLKTFYQMLQDLLDLNCDLFIYGLPEIDMPSQFCDDRQTCMHPDIDKASICE